jgi:formiminoglutamase
MNDLAKITNHRSGEIKFEKKATVPKGVDVITFYKISKYVLVGTQKT